MDKKSLNLFFFLLIAVLVIAGRGYAFAENQANVQKPVRIKADNSITENQKGQLRIILQQYESVIGPLMKQYSAERNVLNRLMRAESIDEAAIRAQHAKTASIAAEITVQRAHLLQKMRAVLTPSQLAEIKNANNLSDEYLMDSYLFRSAGEDLRR